MAILLYILTFVFLLIILVLISPIRLIIDTISNTYALRWKGIVHLKLILANYEPLLRMQIWTYKKDFNLLQKSSQKNEKKQVKKSKSKKTNKMTFQKFKRLIRTFSIEAFYVNLDTDDYIMNGYLYPFFHFIKSQNKSMKINYVGQNNIRLIVENRLYRIIKAYLF